MEEITVYNTGKRVRVRVGQRFKPGEEVTLNVTSSGKRAIRATADLQIVSSTAGADSDEHQQRNTVDIDQMTVKQVLAALENHELEPGFVYAQEREGKQRASILEVVAPNEDSPDTSTGDDPHDDDEDPDTSTPDDGIDGND